MRDRMDRFAQPFLHLPTHQGHNEPILSVGHCGAPSSPLIFTICSCYIFSIAENTGAQGAFLKVKKRRLKFCSVRFETLLLAIKHAMRELKMTRI